MEIRQAFFPRRTPIDAYGNGGFRFAGISHQGSLLCLPSGIYRWEAKTVVPTLADIERVFSEAENIEILLIGTGTEILFISEEIRDSLRMYHIVVDVMSTGAAVRTLNVLLAEERAVAAVLFAVP